jgi:hypothetical protein
MAKNQGVAKHGGARSGKSVMHRAAASGHFVSAHETRVEAVMAAAERSGLLHEKSGRIGGRVSPALVEKAKARTGIATDTDLIEFALANVALEDDFAEAFKAVRGTVDPDLKLGF